MSNEYKDYLLDCAQDFLLEKNYLIRINSITTWKDGYLITGKDQYNDYTCYFVWQNEECNWNCKQIII